MGASPRLRNARLDDAAEISRLAGELGYPSTTQDIAARLAKGPVKFKLVLTGVGPL